MKYKIKWDWYGKEQTDIVDATDDAKPVCIIYNVEDNIVRVDRYIILWDNQAWDWRLDFSFKPARVVPIYSCEVFYANWAFEVGHDGYQLLYNDIVMLEWNDHDETVVFYGRQRLADWFIQEQPVLKEWQIEKVIKSCQALNYLKASIEHEQD